MTFAHEIAVRQSDTSTSTTRCGSARGRDRSERRAGDELGRALVSGADRERRRADPASRGEPCEPRRGAGTASRFAKARRSRRRSSCRAAAPSSTRRRTPSSRRRRRWRAGDDSPSQVLDQYRRDRSVGPEVSPKVDLRVQVTGDARPERVVLIGRDIVVFGPGFKGGTGYSFVTLAQFAGRSRRDGDVGARCHRRRRADLIVRGVRHTRTPMAGTSTPRCCSSTRSRATRSRASSASRRRASDRASASRGSCSSSRRQETRPSTFSPRPGRATGWTEKTYPWAQDPTGGGGHRAVDPAVERHRQRSLPVEWLSVREGRRLTRVRSACGSMTGDRALASGRAPSVSLRRGRRRRRCRPILRQGRRPAWERGRRGGRARALGAACCRRPSPTWS